MELLLWALICFLFFIAIVLFYILISRTNSVSIDDDCDSEILYYDNEDDE